MKTEQNIVDKAYRLFQGRCYHFNGYTPSLNKEEQAMFKGKDVPRAISYTHFREAVERYGIHPKKMLTFSAANDFEMQAIPHNKDDAWDNIVYEENPDAHDVQSLNLPEKDYDFTMLNQTFEHIVDPHAAIKNLYEHLRPGGYFYANWPIVNIRHAEPLHFFTGLTVTYINYLSLLVGFNILECGCWGNKHYIDFLFEHNSWPDYTQLPHLVNDMNCPCIGWILCQKPEKE